MEFSVIHICITDTQFLPRRTATSGAGKEVLRKEHFFVHSFPFRSPENTLKKKMSMFFSIQLFRKKKNPPNASFAIFECSFILRFIWGECKPTDSKPGTLQIHVSFIVKKNSLPCSSLR
jgi:hypothetical protein